MRRTGKHFLKLDLAARNSRELLALQKSEFRNQTFAACCFSPVATQSRQAGLHHSSHYSDDLAHDLGSVAIAQLYRSVQMLGNSVHGKHAALQGGKSRDVTSVALE